MNRTKLRIGTRGSRLALLQAEEVKLRLHTAWPDLQQKDVIEIVPITTSGEWRPEHKEQSFHQLGGNKGWFTKELQEALLAGQIDCAVHSLKDVETRGPKDLHICAVLPRLDPADAFISRKAKSLLALAKGSTIGTASVRRQAQILALRPDLKVVPLRGNVDTRLKKLNDGQVDATILALAGLQRSGVIHEVTEVLAADTMLPAAGQGAIGIECRIHDERVNHLLAAINDLPSFAVTACERAFQHELDGSCTTPIAALATIITTEKKLTLRGLVARTDGTRVLEVHDAATFGEGIPLGRRLAKRLKEQMGENFFVLSVSE